MASPSPKSLEDATIAVEWHQAPSSRERGGGAEQGTDEGRRGLWGPGDGTSPTLQKAGPSHLGATARQLWAAGRTRGYVQVTLFLSLTL